MDTADKVADMCIEAADIGKKITDAFLGHNKIATCVAIVFMYEILRKMSPEQFEMAIHINKIMPIQKAIQEVDAEELEVEQKG